MRIVNGERPSRPPEGKKLRLSDGLWELVRTSWAHKVEERPSVSTFIDFLEKIIRDIAVLKELTELDANSEDDIHKLRRVFGYGDNTFLGIRESETLVVIEVFDRVSLPAHRLFTPLKRSWFQVINCSMLHGRCSYVLQKVSAQCGLLLKSHRIPCTSLVELGGTFPTTGGVSVTCRWSIDGKLMAVKTIIPGQINNLNAFKHVCLFPFTKRLSPVPHSILVLKRLYINGIMWKQLRHPNVVSFLGFGSDFPPISLMYPWMTNGNLSNYVRKHPDVDKLGLVSGYFRHGRQRFE